VLGEGDGLGADTAPDPDPDQFGAWRLVNGAWRTVLAATVILRTHTSSTNKELTHVARQQKVARRRVAVVYAMLRDRKPYQQPAATKPPAPAAAA